MLEWQKEKKGSLKGTLQIILLNDNEEKRKDHDKKRTNNHFLDNGEAQPIFSIFRWNLTE